MRSALFAAVLFAASSTAVFADSGIQISHVWAKSTHERAVNVMKNGVAYMHIVNAGTQADRLVSLESPRARVTEFHEMGRDQNGMMFMRKVPDTSLAPGQSFEMQPGGLHIMLIDITEPLKEGEIIPITLTFEQAGPRTVEVPVLHFRSKGPKTEHENHDHDGHQH